MASAIAEASTKFAADAQGVSLSELDDLLGFYIRRAQVLNFRQFHRRVQATPTQFSMLVLIDANPGLSQVELGEILDMDRATTMAVVRKLHAARWITKRRSRVDRRKHTLRISETGSEALKEMLRSVREHEKQFAAGLSASEAKQLLALMKKLYKTALANGADKTLPFPGKR